MKACLLNSMAHLGEAIMLRLISKDDLDAMLERCYLAGVKSMIITGGSLQESELALSLAHQKGRWPVCLLCLASCSSRAPLANRALCNRGMSSNTFKGV